MKRYFRRGAAALAAAALLLAQAPQLYLLDEPIAYLDLKHQIAMLDLFSALASESQAALAMVLHEPALAWRYSDRVLLIHGDGLTEYGPTQEMLTAGRLSALFQYPLHMLPLLHTGVRRARGCKEYAYSKQKRASNEKSGGKKTPAPGQRSGAVSRAGRAYLRRD
mgnify:CR=1 FL=1